ncbi:MAG TPA: MlaD family protein [Burkholderiales bacterium]|nr:MlaD family protein [Burkholderiales bacterium]
MSDAPQPDRIPAALATPKSGRTFPFVWLVPAIALVVGAWLAISHYLERGTTIVISFHTAEGLQAGKTKIKYKDIDIGQITEISLAPDLSGVVATAELIKGAENRVVEDTRFWVVRPRISGSTVSGLQTLLSGTYVAMDVGKSTTRARVFTGLEQPPAFTTDAPGRQITLRADDAGSLDIGSPVYFRRLQVGQVAAYGLDKDGKSVKITVFINAPYHRFVTSNSRFWHASGIDMAVDSEGVRIKTESLVSIAIGGIAFATPFDESEPAPITADTVFRLQRSQADAFKSPDRIADNYVLVFNQSVRGLQPGAAVDFRGIVVGEVTAIRTQYDPDTQKIAIPVEIRVYPERFTARMAGGAQKSERLVRNGKFMAGLVEHGLRAQLRTGALLTGQLYVALDFFPDAPKVKLDLAQSPPELPTRPSALEDLQQTLVALANKLERMPLDTMAQDLSHTLKTVDTLVKRLDSEMGPTLSEGRQTLVELRKTLADVSKTMNQANGALSAAQQSLGPDSALLTELQDTAREFSRTAQSLRALADYLERNPQSLIRGKGE